MSLPIKRGRQAVVIDQGRARPADRLTALHQAASGIERALQTVERPRDPRSPPARSPAGDRRTPEHGPGAAATDRGGGDGLGLPHEAHGLIRELRDLGRRDFHALKRFLDQHPRLSAALEAGFEQAARADRDGGAYADHGLGIPNADGWA